MKKTATINKFLLHPAVKGAGCKMTHLVLIPLIILLLATSVLAGTITGKVNGPTGLPLIGVPIQVRVQSGDPCGQYFSVGNPVNIDITDATYTISDIPAGTYYLNTLNNNTGYTDEWWDGSLSDFACHSAQTITISAGETVAGKDFQLEIGGSISGLIYQADGATAITGQNEMGANVWIGADPCNAEHVKGVGINPVDGTFIISGLAPGNYFLRNWTNGPAYITEHWAWPTSTTDCSQAQQITVVAGQTEADKNFQLDQGATISGRISGNYGDNVCIQAFTLIDGNRCNREQWAGGSGPDSNGDYSFVVPAGTYFMYFSPNCGNNPNNLLDEHWTTDSVGTTDCNQAGTFTLVAGEATEKNVTLDQEGAIISGTVTASDQNPIEGLAVQASNPGCQWNFSYQATTDANGNYAIVVPGGVQYKVGTCRNCSGSPSGLWIDEYWDANGGTQDCDNTGIITSDVQNPQPANFELNPGAKISGQVTGNYGDNVCADIYTLIDGDTCNREQRAGGTGLDNNGKYSMIVPAGTYFMYFRPDCGNNPNTLLDEYWTDDSVGTTDCNQAATFTLAVGNEPIKNITLDQQGGKIKGTVADGNGAINGDQYNMGVNVIIGDACGNNQHVAGSGLENDGTYSVTVPLDGQYLLRIYSNDTPYLEKWFAGFDDQGNPTSSQNCQDAVTLSFSEGQALIEQVDFNLEKGGRITGTVSDGNGVINGDQYNMGVGVFTGDACGNHQHIAGRNLENNGTYSVTVPLDGQYLLRIYSNDTPYIEKWFAGFDNEGNPTSSYNCGDAAALSYNQGQDLIEHVDFNLEKGGKISGFVYETGGSTPITGETSNVRVDVYSGSPCNYSYIGGGNVDLADGSYLTSALPPGNVYIKINHTTVHPDPWWTATGITENCEEAFAIVISADATTTGKNFNLPKDSDDDGLTDDDEFNLYHTDKFKVDTDGDGIDDGGEIYLWGNDYNGDIDGDNTWNIAESDADNDEVSDLQELARGSDMKNSASVPPPLTLYDDFSSESLDSEKWFPEEYAMVTGNGALQLFVNSPSTYRQKAQTPPTSAQNIRTTFTVNEFARNDGGSVYFTLHGLYYHENPVPALQTGRVYASLSVCDRGSGLEVIYYIGRLIDETGQMTAVKSGSVGTPALTAGTPYKMEIRYDGSNGFIFTLYNNAGAVLGTVGDTGNARGSSLTDRRGLDALALDKGGKIGVSVDSFETSNGADAYTEYDGFQSALDPSLWSTPEIAKKMTDDNKLHLLAHSFGDQLSTRSYLKHRFNYIESKVKIDSRSFQTGSTRGKIRLDGSLYNDSRGPNSPLPYNGNEGNIWGQVTIEYTESDGLYAAAWVERVSNSDWTASEEFLSTRFNMPLSFDTEYILYIGFAGDLLIAGIDSADGTQHEMTAELIQTPKYLPFKPGMEVLARQIGNGGEGMMSAIFDDIRVSGDHLEKAGDVNVDGEVDLSDAILGLQTMTGANNNQTWSAGDVNGDGIIGMPEVIKIIHQVAVP